MDSLPPELWSEIASQSSEPLELLLRLPQLSRAHELFFRSSEESSTGLPVQVQMARKLLADSAPTLITFPRPPRSYKHHVWDFLGERLLKILQPINRRSMQVQLKIFLRHQLFLAFRQRSLPRVKYLLAMGASLDCFAPSGINLIYVAIQADFAEGLAFLLRHSSLSLYGCPSPLATPFVTLRVRKDYRTSEFELRLPDKDHLSLLLWEGFDALELKNLGVPLPQFDPFFLATLFHSKAVFQLLKAQQPDALAKALKGSRNIGGPRFYERFTPQTFFVREVNAYEENFHKTLVTKLNYPYEEAKPSPWSLLELELRRTDMSSEFVALLLQNDPPRQFERSNAEEVVRIKLSASRRRVLENVAMETLRADPAYKGHGPVGIAQTKEQLAEVETAAQLILGK